MGMGVGSGILCIYTVGRVVEWMIWIVSFIVILWFKCPMICRNVTSPPPLW